MVEPTNGRKCEITRERFSLLLDGEGSPAQREEAFAHIRRCPACAGEWAAVRSIHARFAAVRVEPEKEERLAILGAARPLLAGLRRGSCRGNRFLEWCRSGALVPRAGLAAAVVLAAAFVLTRRNRGGMERRSADVIVYQQFVQRSRGVSGFPIGSVSFDPPR